MTDSHRTDDVFGIQREVPKNYVPRKSVDDAFVSSLTRDKHVVVYGSSKQGKSSLRKYNLRPSEYITVTCANNLTLSQLFSAILKEAGFSVTLATTRTVTGESKITVTAEAGLSIPFVRAGGDVTRDQGSGVSVETHKAELELDPNDVNDVIRALVEVNFNKFIVLEDFHYLPLETQIAFSTALKAFHESSNITFIIVGVWLDRNRLIQFNGDLTGRVVSVDADAWTRDELLEVIKAGEALLNLKFDENVVNELLDKCSASVSVVQEACNRICRDEGVTETLLECRVIGVGVDAAVIVKEIVDQQAARYDAFIQRLPEGFQATQLEMYRWLLLPVICASTKVLRAGIPYETIKRIINANHPNQPINLGNISQALGSLSSLQVKKNITPIIFDYDESGRRLNVVDRGFILWRESQAKEDLLEELELPLSPDIPTGLVI